MAHCAACGSRCIWTSESWACTACPEEHYPEDGPQFKAPHTPRYLRMRDYDD